MVTEAYVRRILANPKVADFVRSGHPKVFRKLNRLGLSRSEVGPNFYRYRDG
jgi:hypothetical protein